MKNFTIIRWNFLILKTNMIEIKKLNKYLYHTVHRNHGWLQ